MAPRVVLVTGVSRWLGARLAARLAEDPSVGQVIGVDVVAPSAAMASTLGRADFVRADIRNPMISKAVATAGVDTVVHTNLLATPADAGGRAAMKEVNVIGTMQLLAACQKAPTVRTLVVTSTAAVYGASSRNPALLREDAEPIAAPPSGFAKDAVEVEGYVRGFSRRRPDVRVTLLRFANVLGPQTDSALTRYFAPPVVPTVLGWDPRIQLCHEHDAQEVLVRSTLQSHPGTFNVAGSGVLLLSQAIRRAGRVAVPVAPAAVSLAVLRRIGLLDLSPEQLRPHDGNVVDVTALRTVFGYQPAYSTAEAFADFVQARLAPTVVPDVLGRLEAAALELVRPRHA